MPAYPTAADGRERPHHPGSILLQRAIKLHGGTIDSFAKEVLGRSRVSIWRWQRHLKPIPQAVQARLRTYCAEKRSRDTTPEDSNGR